MTGLLGEMMLAAGEQVDQSAEVAAAFGAGGARIYNVLPSFGPNDPGPKRYVYFPYAQRRAAGNMCDDARFDIELQANIWDRDQEIGRISDITEAVANVLAKLLAPSGYVIQSRSEDFVRIEFVEEQHLSFGIVRFSYVVSRAT